MLSALSVDSIFIVNSEVLAVNSFFSLLGFLLGRVDTESPDFEYRIANIGRGAMGNLNSCTKTPFRNLFMACVTFILSVLI
ncbi:TMhelix containing protein [Vibrio phage 1.063.O._10N.261.45.C7]|nr:TMhelix containing protein [Vibrio phage 1.063.O._10N.261.45.C7]